MIDERVGFRVRMAGDIMVLDHISGGCAPATIHERRAVARIAELEAALQAIFAAADRAASEQEWADRVSAELTDERRALVQQ